MYMYMHVRTFIFTSCWQRTVKEESDKLNAVKKQYVSHK